MKSKLLSRRMRGDRRVFDLEAVLVESNEIEMIQERCSWDCCKESKRYNVAICEILSKGDHVILFGASCSRK